MNQKMEIIRENLSTPILTTKSSMVTGGIVCFAIGVVAGILIGMIGKGLNINVSIGSHNGSNNQGNGCENQYNGKKNKAEDAE